MFNVQPVVLEAYCLYSELDRAIPALFELPGVPVQDGQIHRAVAAVKRLCIQTSQDAILHFKSAYSPTAGALTMYQVVGKNGVHLMFQITNIPPQLEVL